MIDWIFKLKYSPESRCVMFPLHTGMLRLPSRHCSQLLTLQGRSTFASAFAPASVPTTRTTTKLSNQARYKTNFVSSDYPGRYRFVLYLNKWKSINVVYGLLLRTSFSNPFGTEHFVLLEKFCFSAAGFYWKFPSLPRFHLIRNNNHKESLFLRCVEIGEKVSQRWECLD